MRRIEACCVVWMATASLCVGAQQGSGFRPSADLAERVDDYLQRCSAFGFSGSVLVAVGERVVLSKGYGIADRKSGAPCTPETLFDLGSLSKQFTASTVLALAQRGTLSVTDTLPQFFDDVPKDKRAITLRHLLTHTSGLPRGLPNVGSTMNEREALLAAVFAAPMESKPGKQHAYSNLGYDVLAAVVEKATQQPFEDTERALLFEPARMTSTGFRRDGRLDATKAARGNPQRWDPPPAGSLVENDASRFEGAFDERLLATDGWYSWGLRGAGGVLSTVGDLWLWEQALRSDAPLNANSKRVLFDPVRDNYACGWYVLESPRKTPWIAHGGTTGNGFDVYATRYPEERVFFTVLGNGLDVVPWVNINVGKLVFGEKLEPPPPAVALSAEQLERACGDYAAAGGGRFCVSAYDGAWSIEALDAAAFETLVGAAQPREAKCIDASERIVAGLAQADFAALHAVENKQHPLSFMEGWWRRLLNHHGALRSATVLGVVVQRGVARTVTTRLEFERGAELFQLRWSGEELGGVNIGPPYPSRRRFVPLSEHEGVDYDLVAGKTAASVRFEGAKLELTLGGRTLAARRE